ncbi:S-layer homology domain-containing protein [Brevibacillus sp. LEMMJ03]|uniref:S-layer homology domain-containing protein n=1 Tax=Brevibacillus sp. LEMMJ03 TaxID=2595056 RepID=UPI00117F7F76|nr:S-layer homology domain-containing protein [Brevibacillus sp. LEMMJ03]TRY22971.1 S-layer homology domain-containing protein [Brevibacillus sp. LEMMJ03]
MKKFLAVILALSLVGSAHSLAFAEKKATVSIPEGTSTYKIVDKEGNFVDLVFSYKEDEITVVVSVPNSETAPKIITVPLRKTEKTNRDNAGVDSKNDSMFMVPTDSVNHWARNDILLMNQLGLLRGYPDGTFKPEKAITRAEYAALLERVLKMTSSVPQPVETTVFTDVKPSDWFFGPVSSLVVRKNINPAIYSERLFAPNAAIPREEIALWTAVDVPEVSSQDVTFKDESAMKYPVDVKKVAAAGLLKGFPDGTFRSTGSTTRAEAATMMVRYLRMKGVIQ